MTFPALSTCPHCARANDMHSGSNVLDAPSEGDVSLCWRCHGVAIFCNDGSLRLPTEDELASVLADPGVKAALRSMKESYTPFQAVAMTQPMPVDINDD